MDHARARPVARRRARRAACLTRAAPLSLALGLSLAACSSPRDRAPPFGLGRAVFTGPVKGVTASADGTWLAVLDGCRDARQRVLPPGTASCDLELVPSAGGEARRVGDGVSTLAGQVRWAPEGALLAAMTGYDYASGTGTLVVVEGGGREGRVEEAAFFGFEPADRAVVAIARGRVAFVLPGAPPRWADGATEVATFELSPRWPAARAGELASLMRKPSSAGGTLLGVEGASGAVKVLAQGTAEYAFSRDGAYAFTVPGKDGTELRLAPSPAAKPATVGRKVRGFAFAVDGSGAIAWVGEAEPGKQGDLHVRESDGREAVLAREVGEYRWAARAPRLAWLERYDARVRSGTVGAGGPGLAPRRFVGNVSDVEISPDGAHLAWLQHTTRGGYSVDLGLVALDDLGAAPVTVASGVFGFAFSPDGRWLYYRTRCTRNAEACDLERVPAAGLAPGAKPEGIAAGAKSFEFDPRDPGRLLVTWQRMDRDALDVGVWAGGTMTKVDTYVVPGTAKFLGPDSKRVIYAVMQEKRAGVYVAEVK